MISIDGLLIQRASADLCVWRVGSTHLTIVGFLAAAVASLQVVLKRTFGLFTPRIPLSTVGGNSLEVHRVQNIWERDT